MSCNTHHPQRQAGAALVTSLLLLVVLTILGITTMQMTRMQERMAGNTRDISLAFQAAEAALRDGEALIDAAPTAPIPCSTPPCNVYQTDFLPLLTGQGTAWWNTNGIEYGVTGTDELADTLGVAQDPRRTVEYLRFVPDDLMVGGATTGRDFYQVTGYSRGASNNAYIVLQTTFAKSF
ncbi:MAG: pilus assembly protein PilZ [Proteobacteria bacterium]|nr:pilus assembly protein PilZ [Pseudomonadota bacterium]